MKKHDTDLANALITKAFSKQHSTFEFLRNLQSLRAAESYRGAIVKIMRSFDKICKCLFQKYMRASRSDAKDALDLLNAYFQAAECYVFYEDEAEIIADIIDEYKAYLFQGHLAETVLLGIDRREEDLKDARICSVDNFRF